MASFVKTDSKLVLKYPDKDTFTFSKFKPASTDTDLYAIAGLLNAFQTGATSQVVKSETSEVLQ